MNTKQYIACLEIIKGIAIHPSGLRFNDRIYPLFSLARALDSEYENKEAFPSYFLFDEAEEFKPCVVHLAEDELLYVDEYLDIKENIQSVKHFCDLYKSSELSRG